MCAIASLRVCSLNKVTWGEEALSDAVWLLQCYFSLLSLLTLSAAHDFSAQSSNWIGIVSDYLSRDPLSYSSEPLTTYVMTPPRHLFRALLLVI
jgi:hypothetical protein